MVTGALGGFDLGSAAAAAGADDDDGFFCVGGFLMDTVAAALLDTFLGGMMDGAVLLVFLAGGGGCLSLSPSLLLTKSSSSSLLLLHVADRPSDDELDEGASSLVAESVDQCDGWLMSSGFLFLKRAGLEDGLFLVVGSERGGAVFSLSEDVEEGSIGLVVSCDLRPLMFTTPPGLESSSIASPFLSFLALPIFLFKKSWVSCCLFALETPRNVILEGISSVNYI